MGFTFRSKAETLEILAPQLRCAQVLPLYYVSVARWRAEQQSVLGDIYAQSWSASPLIVRSSASDEDGVKSSQAGRFLSVPDVTQSSLVEAIDRVIASYGDNGSRVDQADLVLIQPMLKDVVTSGVVFTRDPSTGSPYLVAEGADGEDTGSVTGGRKTKRWTHTLWLAGSPPLGDRLKALRSLALELIDITHHDSLDFEFAFDANGALWLFQVRPLKVRANPLDGKTLDGHIQGIIRKVATAMCPHPLLHGARTVFGVMPDWNPAEIIGTRPRPLALSLYRDLVTDSIWAYQRHNYGYRNLRSFPLMIHFGGLPYIDVRVSFNSFLPKDIDGDLAEKLVDYYIERLLVSPALHDKVEFEIVLSAYTFDLPKRLEALRGNGFSASDLSTLSEALRRLTNRIINRKTGLWQSDAEKLFILEQRRDRILASRLAPTEKIYWLLEDCKRYGTLPFAGLARAGFIAVQMLRSLVLESILTEQDRDAFMGCLATVGSKLAHDTSVLDRDAFLKRYGHLRPGTYDIRSPRYDKAPELYGIGEGLSRHAQERAKFGLSLTQMRSIEELLSEHGLENDVVGLFDFFQAAIEGREHAKFVFTRNLSDALELLAEIGEPLGFTREDLSFADVGVIHELQASNASPSRLLAESIHQGRKRFEVTQSLLLPPVIATPGDVWSFTGLEAQPNFITLGQVTAPVKASTNPDIKGAVICIEGADPGYDWIFGHQIAGLITAFGGANSHMAIRAAELGIPAAIGVGEANYACWSRAQMLYLDCAARKVEVLR
ncbi:conserved protein of unknown function [Magnetospirillum sp. XM-1]|uniref:PEP-utilizing enzyme n=1 Tax=Magnetospirillum sp. XM-1 TaxID=1663591 RepID=UPI00073DE854|nr:PEP/pyruvate-binding domain-containing protein [Magnetospirillum sp. XM-1]CUW39524.1 conserved protein of unknown function [Magnetospirillum sp. XM-1]